MTTQTVGSRELAAEVALVAALRAGDARILEHGCDRPARACGCGPEFLILIGRRPGFDQLHRAVLRREVDVVRPYINSETEQAIRAALSTGKGIRKVAREIGVGTSVVQRIKAERTNGELLGPA